MNWLRLYTSVLDDVKVQRLPAETFRGWINVLCLARRHNGVLPAISDVAWALRIEQSTADRLLEELQRAGLLENTDVGLCPHNWDQRQYDSDTSAERMRRLRAKKRAEKTLSDTETDTEQEQKQIQSKSRHRKQHGDGLCDVTHDADASFETEFWPLYPLKVAKVAARKAWKKQANSPEKRQAIVQGLQAQLPSLRSRERQFCPYPSTWLNGRRWEDASENNGRTAGPRPDRHQIHEQRVSDEFDALMTQRLERGKQLQ